LCCEAHNFSSMCATSLLEVPSLTFKLHCSFSGSRTVAGWSWSQWNQFSLLTPFTTRPRTSGILLRGRNPDIKSGFLYLALFLAHCLWMLYTRLCATQATLYQATNVYHWYLVMYFPWDCDFHVIMKDYPCLGVFSVT
jgi:hypothetical protein